MEVECTSKCCTTILKIGIGENESNWMSIELLLKSVQCVTVFVSVRIKWVEKALIWFWLKKRLKSIVFNQISFEKG